MVVCMINESLAGFSSTAFLVRKDSAESFCSSLVVWNTQSRELHSHMCGFSINVAKIVYLLLELTMLIDMLYLE